MSNVNISISTCVDVDSLRDGIEELNELIKLSSMTQDEVDNFCEKLTDVLINSIKLQAS